MTTKQGAQPAPEAKPKPPQCWGKRRNLEGDQRQCINSGVWVYVVGSFGRLAQILCHGCIATTREKGWKVTYMLEGDKPTQVDAVSDSPAGHTGEGKVV